MPKLDFVTVCFAGELRLLELQARSFTRYLDPGLVGTIHVIINDRRVDAFTKQFYDRVAPAYGALRPKVRLVDYRTLWTGEPRRLDWASQQVLKLLVARHCGGRAMMILDAKNHFIRPLTEGCVIAADGRMRSHLYPMARKFLPQYRQACRYVGYTGEIPEDIVLPTTTPFLAVRDLVLALLKTVEEKEGRRFQDFFLRADGAFTEFCLYSAFHLKAQGPFDRTYERRPGPTATLFRGAASRPDRAAEVLDGLADETKYCMGVHREVLLAAHPDILKAVGDAWQRFGLVDSPEEAAYFLDAPRRALRQRFTEFLRI